MNTPMKYEDVVEELDAAERRLSELESVLEMFIENSGDKNVVELCKHVLSLTELSIYEDIKP